MYKSLVLSLVLTSVLCVAPSQAQISFTGQINADYTLYVPSEFSDINDALDYLSDKTFKSGVVITIQVANGSYSHGQVAMTHPQGEQIQILGNTTTPSSCTLNFTATAFSVTDGHTIGYLDGFTLVGSNAGYGLYSGGGSTIRCGSQLDISGFTNGVYADTGGNITAAGVISHNNTQNGFFTRGGSINANSAKAHHNSITGVASIAGGSISFTSGESYNNTMHGIQVYGGGTVYANSCSSHHNSQHGLLAQSNGTIYAPGGSSASNTYNVTAQSNGHIEYP